MVVASLAALAWFERLSRAMEGDGEEATFVQGQVLAHEGPLNGNDTMTQAAFDAVPLEATWDDFLRALITLPTAGPERPALSLVNCGTSLAAMGKMGGLMPNAFSRVVNGITSQPGGGLSLAINQVHNIMTVPPVNYIYTVPNGSTVRDQIDITNEGQTPGAIQVSIRNAGGAVLASYVLNSGETFYFTAIWDGTAWKVMRA